jgi:hypothetical protein
MKNPMAQFTVRKNWMSSLEVMLKRPIVILPFIIIAFLEGLALELIYFSTRKPISFIACPIIKKFFGEPFIHYPYNLMKLPGLFYYLQIAIYIFAGVFLMAMSVNIYKNIKEGLPLKTSALIKNATNRYTSFVTFGAIIIILIFLLRRVDTFIFSKLMHLLLPLLPEITPRLYSLGSTLFLFFSNIVMQTFLVLTIPIVVIKRKPLLKALVNSISLGFHNFFAIFTLISLPFLLYLPITLLKSYAINLADKTFPAITLYIMGVGIIATLFIECFIIICASQFLLERDKNLTPKTI